ncbi:MAG TPA: TetR/AcrR family transcriptional regulator C-terminal domain-containing protein [Candidatus Dormibacteraeota bacterium]|jgi:TetR/AcrR family tetracycline transcriptional repressor|nr:TetR/AcrR family transcriptional regulator C-terminal domain-containing protein [Candidatus Dormibacteraeota bacterium]
MALKREIVVETALRLLNEVGVDGLSTRRLAVELGVRSPALYWHFKDKQDLLDQMASTMVARALAGLESPAPGQDWAGWLCDRARAFRGGLLAYRDGARVHAGSRPEGEDLRPIWRLAEMMEASGLSRLDAIRGIVAVSRYTVGCVAEEQATGPRAFDDDPDAGFEFGLRLLLRGLGAPD